MQKRIAIISCLALMVALGLAPTLIHEWWGLAVFRVSNASSHLPAPASVSMGFYKGGGGNGPPVGQYNRVVSFAYTTSLSGVAAFRVYYQKPGEAAYSLVAIFSNPSSLYPAPTGSCSQNLNANSGTWKLRYCDSGGQYWQAFEGTYWPSYFSLGQYNVYVVAADTAGVEGAPSTVALHTLLDRAVMLSPSTFSSLTPTFRWTVASGWPPSPYYWPSVYEATSPFTYKWSKSVSVSNTQTEASVTYSGPSLDPAKSYVVGIWGEGSKHFSMGEANQVFTVASASPTPTPTPTPSPSASFSPSPTPSATPSSSPTPSPTPSPSATPTPTPIPTSSPQATPTPTPTPSLAPTPTPSLTPTLTPSATPVPTPTPTPSPSSGPTASPSATPQSSEAAAGQAPTPSPSSTPIPTTTTADRITGKVMNKDGIGLPNVQVHAFREKEAGFSRTVTDSSGNYMLFITPGVWMVRAEPYPESRYANPQPPIPVALVLGIPGKADFTLVFADATLEGAVVDEFGNALTTISGYVMIGDFGSPPHFGGPVSNGRFSFNVPAGSYIAYLKTAPDADYAAGEPVPLAVAPGEKKSLMFRAASRTAEIRGFVTDESGRALTALAPRIVATGPGGAWQEGVYDATSGSYRVSVAKGNWSVRVALDPDSAYLPVETAAFEIALVPTQVFKRDIILKRAGATLTSLVRKPDGTPLASALVSIERPEVVQSVPTGQPLRLERKTDVRGFSTFRVPAGMYTVRVFAPPSLGYLNPDNETLTLGEGELRNLVFTLRPSSAELTGRVTLNGKGVRAFVSAWSESGGYAEKESREGGSYTLSITQNESWRVMASRSFGRDLFRADEVPVKTGSNVFTQDLTLVAVAKKLPDPVSAPADPSSVTVVGVKDGPRLTIPSGAIPAIGKVTVTITPDERVTRQSAAQVVGNAYAVEMRGADAQAVTTFNADVIINFPYDEKDISAIGAKPADLALSFWDANTASWRRLATSAVDAQSRLVSGAVRHLTRFALVAPADTQPPDPPSNVRVAETAAGFAISWANPSYDFHHAKIYRSTEKWIMGNLAHNNLSGTSKDDVFAKDSGKIYYYTVRAVDLAGNESTNTTQYTVSGPAQTPSPKEQAAQAPVPPVEQIPEYQKYPNGTLLRARSDQKIWIIKNGFRRYVVGPQILGFYEHLKQAPVVEVPKEELDRYNLAAWVRYINSPKVYEVNDDATKHWLDMSAEDFYNTGRRWEAVFIVNKKEVDFYKTGSSVTILK